MKGVCGISNYYYNMLSRDEKENLYLMNSGANYYYIDNDKYYKNYNGLKKEYLNIQFMLSMK